MNSLVLSHPINYFLDVITCFVMKIIIKNFGRDNKALGNSTFVNDIFYTI